MYGAQHTSSQITPFVKPPGYATDAPGGFTISKCGE